MCTHNIFLFIFSTYFIFSEAAFVDNLPKCSFYENECQKTVVQYIFKNIGDSGIPEYDFPPIDPYVIKDFYISVADIVHIVLVEGVAKGAKDCVVNNVVADTEKQKFHMEMTCDLTIKGKYVANATGPIIESLLGDVAVHGDGKAKIVIENLQMTVDTDFIVKEKNGELHFEWPVEARKHSFTVGKMTYAANNIFLGEQDASELVVKILNDNWRFIMENYGKTFLDSALSVVYDLINNFFDAVPIKYYYTDDLTSYLKKN